VFANNFNADVTVVRPGARYRGIGQTVIGWEPLGLRAPFIYDPSQGQDFVIQIRSCGIGVMWGQQGGNSEALWYEAPFWQWGIRGTIGANSYYSNNSCNETAHTVYGYESLLYTRMEYYDAATLFADFYLEGWRAGEPVVFDDRSHSPVVGGIVSWLWMFGDGSMSILENPVHTYTCQGTYAVSLIVTDAANNVAMKQRTFSLTSERFTVTSTGVGDLFVTPPRLRCFPQAVRGHTLVSFATMPGSVGQGPFFGLRPDLWTYFCLSQPAGSPNAFHFLAAPGHYPDVPLDVPPGFFSPLAGLTMDAVVIYYDALGIPVHVSNAAQVTF
jgi:hypothetical protein